MNRVRLFSNWYWASIAVFFMLASLSFWVVVQTTPRPADQAVQNEPDGVTFFDAVMIALVFKGLLQ